MSRQEKGVQYVEIISDGECHHKTYFSDRLGNLVNWALFSDKISHAISMSKQICRAVNILKKIGLFLETNSINNCPPLD